MPKVAHRHPLLQAKAALPRALLLLPAVLLLLPAVLLPLQVHLPRVLHPLQARILANPCAASLPA